jgi:predicted nucleic acid-binding Zn ribbon protein
MPKYVYQNLETGEQYEFEQSFHDDAYTHHPSTGAPVKRLIFAPAVVFKGSGWYAKDSKPSKPAVAKPGESSAGSSETSPATETPSETPAKPEATKTEAAAPASNPTSG